MILAAEDTAPLAPRIRPGCLPAWANVSILALTALAVATALATAPAEAGSCTATAALEMPLLPVGVV